MSGTPTAASLELAEAYSEAQVPDWDGYGAVPVEGATYKHAQRFICTLPRMFPLPDVAAEPDGYICFDWYDSPSRQFSVSIDSSGGFHYSGVFGDSKVYGEEKNKGVFPNIFIACIRRVYGNE